MATHGTDRTAEVTWQGDLTGGEGTIERVGSGALGPLPITWTARAEEPNGLTSPEELIAAAHAACFSMALSLGLSDAGHPPSSVNTAARVHLRVVGGAPAIQQIDLTTEADVPGLGPEEIQDCAEQAKSSCIISRALGGVAQINLSATLAS